MKRILTLVLVLCFSIGLSACFSTTQTTTKSTFTSSTTDPTTVQFNQVKLILQEFQTKEPNGFDYSAVQKNGNVVLNQIQVTQRIDRQTPIKMMTEVESLELSYFDVNHQFTPKNTVYYYRINEIGVQENEGPVSWRSGTLSDYYHQPQPITSIDLSVFEQIHFEVIGSETKFAGLIKPNEIKNVLINQSPLPSQAAIQITYNHLTNQLVRIEITLINPFSITTIVFQPYWQVATVVLP